MRSVIESPQAGGNSRDSLAQMMEETKDARELKRAWSVKMVLEGMATVDIGEVLHVTPR
jgi:hypothetical protein